MATSSRGGAAAPRGSQYDQPKPVANAAAQPEAKPAGPTGKVTTVPQPRLSQRGYMPPTRTIVTHAPKGPSESDLIFQREVNAIGPKAVKAASNPRVAAAQQILGAATGIPALAHAARSGNVLATAGEAATFLPLGRIGRILKAGVDAAEEAGRIGKATEGAVRETAPKVSYISGGVPRIVKGQSTAATGGELGREVREGLTGAKVARTAQDKLYSAERSKRAALGAQAMQQGGVAGYHAALGQLKGALPKIQFGGLRQFSEPELDQLVTHIQNHPTLRFYDKIRAQGALFKVLHGTVPTKSEMGLLEKTFGKPLVTRLSLEASKGMKLKNLAIGAINVPRSLMASFDLSAPFRQGLVFGAAHPRLFFKNFMPMIKAFGSEKVYQSILEDIHQRPNFPLYHEAGISFTELHGPQALREEQFPSDLAEHIPVLGRGVHASGRAYTAFLDKSRADYFDYLHEVGTRAGYDMRDPKRLKAIGTLINAATGRGRLPGKTLQESAPILNTLFFSPRLFASRLHFLNPATYLTADPLVRKENLRAAMSLVSFLGATLSLAKLAGANVNTDPRNADFAKIKLGDTRIDLAGGFQQPIRLLAELISGKAISSTTGKTLRIGPEGPGNVSRFDLGLRFLEQKLSPTPSLVVDLAKQKNQVGQNLEWGFNQNNPLFQRMLPLLLQDANDIRNQYHSPGLAAGGYALGAFGIGLQTYSPKPPKGRQSFGSGNPYTQSSGGGSSSDYAQAPAGSSGGGYNTPAVP